MSTHPTGRHSREHSGAGMASSREAPAADDVTAKPAGETTGRGGDRIGVSGTQVAASVLASVSAAVVASFFGVAGTIVGAAVVSVFATVGSAAYGLGIRRTKQRLQALQQVQALRITRSLPRRAGVARPTAADQTDRTDQIDLAAEAEAVADAATGWRAWMVRRRWGLAAGVALVFVISMAVITLIELVGDRPLSGERDGGRTTTIGALLAGGDGSDGGEDSPVTVTDPTSGSSTTAPPDGEGETDPGATETTTPEGGATTTTAPDTATTTAPTTGTTAADADSSPATDPEPITPPADTPLSAG